MEFLVQVIISLTVLAVLLLFLWFSIGAIYWTRNNLRDVIWGNTYRWPLKVIVFLPYLLSEVVGLALDVFIGWNIASAAKVSKDWFTKD